MEVIEMKLNKLNAGRCPRCGRYMYRIWIHIDIESVSKSVEAWVCKNYETCNRNFKPK